MFQQQSKAWKVTLYFCLIFMFLVSVCLITVFRSQQSNLQAIQEEMQRVEELLPIVVKEQLGEEL